MAEVVDRTEHITDEEVIFIRGSHIDDKLASIVCFAPFRVTETIKEEGQLVTRKYYEERPVLIYTENGKHGDYIEITPDTYIQIGKRIYVPSGKFSRSQTMPQFHAIDPGSARKPKVMKTVKEIEKYILEHVDINNLPVGTPEFLSLWCLGTYFYDAFPAYPYIWVNGEREVGKSQMIETLSYLSFNGQFITSLRPSPIYREVDSMGSTLCIDEAEDLWTENKSDESKEIVSLLNSGYKHGAEVPRTNTEKMVVEKYRTYSPKVFASIYPIDDTLSSRCVLINMRKMPEEVSVDKPFPRDTADIRNILYSARLRHGTSIFLGYPKWRQNQDLHRSYGISQRAAEIFGPLLYLSHRFIPRWIDPFVEFIKDQVELRKRSKKLTIESAIMLSIRETVGNLQSGKVVWVSIRDIKKGLRGGPYARETSRKIGIVMNRLGFTEARQVKGRYERKINVDDVIRYLQSHGLYDEKGKKTKKKRT